jgi:transcriptional regulator with XRE-family HTH domain
MIARRRRELRTAVIVALGVPDESMDTVPLTEARRELAHFLASRRARLTPHEVGLTPGRRRRVPGLRRQEVAVLASVSETWYARLEQGQPINASADVLDAIADALRLDCYEREYLFVLTGRVGVGVAIAATNALPPVIATTIAALEHAPAVVYGPRWDVWLQNHAYVAVFGDIANVPIARGNFVRQFFLDRSRRTLFPEWESVARMLLQNFRISAGRRAGDPTFAELITSLCAESPEFRDWWDEHDVVRGAIGEKRVEHPIVGTLMLDHVALAIPDYPDINLIVFTAVRGSESERKLCRLTSPP